MPARRPDGARDRILDAADALFYSQGIHRTGIDEIIATAGVAKASLYKHFESKDALIAAYVARRDEEWREAFERRLREGDHTPRERLLRVFDLLGEWFRTRAFRGCAFINASVELADARHAGHVAAVRNKRALRAMLTDLARQARLAHPERVADQLAMLADGAIVTAAMERDAGAAARARAVAELVVRAA